MLEPHHRADIAGILTKSPPVGIERDLARLLHTIAKQGGSPGSELVAAGFQPAPYVPARYEWKGRGLAGPTSVEVAIDGERIDVKVKGGQAN